MGIKNLFIGVAIGVGVLMLIKKDPQQPSQGLAIAGSPAVLQDDRPSLRPVSNTTNLIPDPGRQANLASQPKPDLQFPQRPGLLKQLLRESTAEAHVTVPTREELIRFEELLLMTLRHQSSWRELSSLWSSLGWKLECWTTAGTRLAAVCEPSDGRRGRGIYIFRIDSTSRIALQAPHRFYDTQTGLLTRKLFVDNDVLMAAWNTVHRDQVDVAHRKDHFINAMTRALIRFDSGVVVAQVHGFDNQKRESAARAAAMIVSDTTQYPGRLVQRFAEAQKGIFGGDLVRLYPTEVSELGGTLNQQARVFHSMGRLGFLHIEMDRNIREKLTSDASVRDQFFSALTSATANWQDSRRR